MIRREFITFLGGAVVAWPGVAGAPQPTRMRRVGALFGTSENDSSIQPGIGAFRHALADMGWSEGRNLRIDWRWGNGNAKRYRELAAELVALAPDVLFAGGPTVAPLRRETRIIPIVFAALIDPVGSGYVTSLARPGGNVTGFASSEFGISGKWLELLKQIAPHVTRVAVIRDVLPPGFGQFGAIQDAAPPLGVEVRPLNARDTGEIERGIEALARMPNGGLVVVTSAPAQVSRALIISLAARHKVPAVYPSSFYVAEGGLISYGIGLSEPFRLAAGYVDRILKGERPADLPVQAPVKYETVLNLKTAKALGLPVPDIIRLRADEVIE
jgi:putative ABC transport system substrate-binding protein